MQTFTEGPKLLQFCGTVNFDIQSLILLRMGRQQGEGTWVLIFMTCVAAVTCHDINNVVAPTLTETGKYIPLFDNNVPSRESRKN